MEATLTSMKNKTTKATPHITHKEDFDKASLAKRTNLAERRIQSDRRYEWRWWDSLPNIVLNSPPKRAVLIKHVENKTGWRLIWALSMAQFKMSTAKEVKLTNVFLREMSKNSCKCYVFISSRRRYGGAKMLAIPSFCTWVPFFYKILVKILVYIRPPEWKIFT